MAYSLAHISEHNGVWGIGSDSHISVSAARIYAGSNTGSA